MNKTEQAQQLRLAAGIIETDHPWHLYRSGRLYDTSPLTNPAYYAAQSNTPSEWEIRPILATPPDGKPLHNPDNLSAEQVGLGYRLVIRGEPPHEAAEVWSRESEAWQPRDAVMVGRPYLFSNESDCYRLPLSVPWPDATPQTTKQVPLEPEDVPPGSWLKFGNGPSALFAIVEVRYASVVVGAYEPACKSYRELYDGFQINRSIPLTGKWDANAWEPCSKEVQA